MKFGRDGARPDIMRHGDIIKKKKRKTRKQKAKRKAGSCSGYTTHGQRAEQETVFPAAFIDPIGEVSIKEHKKD